jgi:ubiquinone/menaquinone biosynthesis C-methylase UbiE
VSDERPALKSFDRVADVYDETRGLPDDVAAGIGDALAALLRRVAEQPRLLEVGIGTGRMAVPLAARGIRVTGIDIAPAMLARLRTKRSDIDLMLAEASHLPLRPATFDAALFVHILHLVPDAAATLRATLPLVRAGGVIIQGSDDHGNTVRAEADRVMQRAMADAAGLADEPRVFSGGGQLLQDVLRERGARVESLTLATWQSSTTGHRMLERLARKDFSSSWRIPDAALPAVIAAATPQLEALLGSLDAPVTFERRFHVTVGWLPA